MIGLGSDKNGLHSWPLGSKICVFEYYVHFVGFVITALHKYVDFADENQFYHNRGQLKDLALHVQYRVNTYYAEYVK